MRIVAAVLAGALACPSNDPGKSCTDSGGRVVTGSCCAGAGDYPETCSIGACGCSPANSAPRRVCECPAGKCFDGIECVAGEPVVCGGIAALGCPAGEACTYDPCCQGTGADCSGWCGPPAAVAAPCVRSGCSGELCAEEPLVSACIWRPGFACYGSAVCERQANDLCGWTMTPALAACLAAAARCDPLPP